MPLVTMKRYTRQIIRENPDWLFVFGDNTARSGYGGQAREARGEPNAVGITTKHFPTLDMAAYFKNSDQEAWEEANKAAWERLENHLWEGKVVVWPVDGIGTDRAKLDIKAPKILFAIDRHYENLIDVQHKAH